MPGMLCSHPCSPFLGSIICVTALSPPPWGHLHGPCVGQVAGGEGCSTHGQLRLRAVEVGIEEHGDVAVASLQCDGNSIVPILKKKGEHLGRGLGTGCGVGEHPQVPAVEAYAVHDGDVAGGLSQQQLHCLHAAVLAGAHQRGRALLILQVHVGSAGEQGFHHLLPAVADGQHQRRLASLRHKGCCQAAPTPTVPPALPAVPSAHIVSEHLPDWRLHVGET